MFNDSFTNLSLDIPNSLGYKEGVAEAQTKSLGGFTMKYPQDQMEAAKNHFSDVKPGDTLYTTVTHVARSGMSRSIKLFVIEDGVPMDRSWAAARLLGNSMDEKNGGVKMGGWGMDMGFHLVYSLGHKLFPVFKCAGKNCPANDHTNDRNFKKSRIHSDAGYSLRQRWI